MVELPVGARPAGGGRDVGSLAESVIYLPPPLPYKTQMGASPELASREREKVQNLLGAGMLAQESLILKVNELGRQESKGTAAESGSRRGRGRCCPRSLPRALWRVK